MAPPASLTAMLLLCIGSATAAADPPAAPTSPEVLAMTQTARNVARAKHCESIKPVAQRVRELDPGSYASVFVVDPSIATCLPHLPAIAPPEPAIHVEVAPKIPGVKSRETASWLSGGTTLGGAGAIVLAGLLIDGNHHGAPEWLLAGGIGAALVGPTLGHAYAGHAWNPWLGVRHGGIAAVALGTGITVAEGSGSFNNLAPLIAGLLVGSGLYAIGTVGEIVTAPDAVDDDYNRAYNRAHVGAWLTLAPLPTSRGVVPGVGLLGRF